MRVLLAISILASILLSSSIAAEAGPLETAPHFLPRRRSFPFNREPENSIRIRPRTDPSKKGFRDSRQGRRG
jgi:hypothetical protein